MNSCCVSPGPLPTYLYTHKLSFIIVICTGEGQEAGRGCAHWPHDVPSPHGSRHLAVPGACRCCLCCCCRCAPRTSVLLCNTAQSVSLTIHWPHALAGNVNQVKYGCKHSCVVECTGCFACPPVITADITVSLAAAILVTSTVLCAAAAAESAAPPHHLAGRPGASGRRSEAAPGADT